MPKEKFDHSGPLIAIAIAIPLGIVVCDIVGRIQEFFIQEWPHISWGLLILILAISIIWIFIQFLNIHEHLEAELIEKTSALQKVSDGTRNDVAQLSRRMESLADGFKKEIREVEQLNKKNAQDIEELLERKGPIVPTDIQPDESTLAEIAEGFYE